MSNTIAPAKRRRLKGKTYLWMLGSLASNSALIYWEQTALLYTLSTLAMCVLLLVVGFSKIEDKDVAMDQPAKTAGTKTVVTGVSSSSTKRQEVA